MSIRRFVVRNLNPNTPEEPTNLIELKKIFDENVSLVKCDWASDTDKTLQIKNVDTGNVILDIKLTQFEKEIDEGYKDGYGLIFTVHIANGDTVSIPKNINSDIGNSTLSSDSTTSTIDSTQTSWDKVSNTYDQIARKYNCIPEIIISGKSIAFTVMNSDDKTVFVKAFLVITKTKKNELAVISSLLTPEKIDKLKIEYKPGGDTGTIFSIEKPNSCFCLTNNSEAFDLLFFDDVTPQTVYDAEIMTMNPILVNGDNDYCTDAYFTYFSQMKNTTCSMLVDNKRYYYNGYVLMPES